MKILQIVHSLPPHSIAGTEVYAYNLSKQLATEHEVSIFHRINDFKLKEYEISHKKENNVSIYSINNTFRSCYSFEGLYTNPKIDDEFERVLNTATPDIVHIHHLIFLSTGLVEKIRRRGIPIVFTLHDYWMICPQWHYLKKDLSLCDKNDIAQCLNCLDDQLNISKAPKKIYSFIRNIAPGFILDSLRRIYLDSIRLYAKSSFGSVKIKARENCMKELCRAVDTFIAPSQFLKKKFLEFGIPEEKLKFIRYGINTESFRSLKGRPSERIRFAFIGSVLPAKGVDILMNAFNQIQNTRAELRIYGKLFPYRGFEYYPKKIKKIAMGKNIKFMGGFDNRDLARVFSEIDILVVPSIWHENSPLVIQEAFLSKTPVIASRIGGIPELINDGINGILFNPQDMDDLRRRMQYIIDNPDVIESFKDNMPKVKTIEENAAELEEIYFNLFNKKGNLCKLSL